MNRKYCYCHIAVSGGMLGYMNKKFYFCHIVVSGEMIGYVNGKSCCCYTAIPDKVLKSGKRAQLMKCRMRKDKLVD